MSGVEGQTIYRVGNPTLGASGLGLTYPDPQPEGKYTTVFTVDASGPPYVHQVRWQGDPLPAPKWYDRLWTALTKPRTLWAWLTPWR